MPRSSIKINLVAASARKALGFLGFLAMVTWFGGGIPGQLWAEPANPFGLDEKHPLQVDSKAGEVRLLAELQPQAFSGGWLKSTPNYHAVVWKGGGAAGEALLSSYADDSSFYDALVSIGAIPGNNLTMAAWNKRKDPNSTAPDTRVEGSPVDVFVWWDGLPSPLPLAGLLNDSAGKGIDMRFGGNKALIPEWHSGCIACLYSCPGGKVSNHAYTIRDYVKGTTLFSVNQSVVPKEKHQAVVIFRKR
ncbi:MAG: hypothetical protein HY913_08475 [Desulfomonile tiedjei]|nr:hypothetical protein [Desulfomonile tiedjei]